MIDLNSILADRTKGMSQNAVREILKVTSRPDVISLAGGLPAPESFPIGIINTLHELIMTKYGSQLFQYGMTEGFIPFREAIIEYVAKKGVNADIQNVVVTSGSQGALDAIAKILVNKGDVVAVESPTYLGAMTAFNPYEPVYVQIDTDDEGIIPESLESIVKTQKVKFVYLNPTFQNPTGRTLSDKRRKQVAEILIDHNVIAVEDNPYGDIRYRGNPTITIKSLAPDNVIYLGTFSKIFAPGFRLGFAIAPTEICGWMTNAKQGVDLHSNSYGQALATEYMRGGYYDTHLPRIISVYKPKQEAMLKAIEKHFPKGFKWSKPDGGMFIWAEGPKSINTDKLYWEAIKRNVAYVPGSCFFAKSGEGTSTMRLNFTNATIENIDIAIQKLGEMFTEKLEVSE